MNYIDKEVAYVIEYVPDPTRMLEVLNVEQVEVASSYIGFSEEEKAEIESRYPGEQVYFEWEKEYNP